jgi:hypothetical protein
LIYGPTTQNTGKLPSAFQGSTQPTLNTPKQQGGGYAGPAGIGTQFDPATGIPTGGTGTPRTATNLSGAGQGTQLSKVKFGYTPKPVTTNSTQDNTGVNPLTSTFNIAQGQGTTPTINTTPAINYGYDYNNYANQANATTPIANLGKLAGAAPVNQNKFATEDQVSGNILTQLRNTTAAGLSANPTYQAANTSVNKQLDTSSLLPTITTAIQSALAPQDQYNQKLRDSMYADATRRETENLDREQANIRKQYNAYNLGGSSAEAEALRQSRDASNERILSAQRNIDTQTMQNAQQYGNTQLTQLANILGTVGSQQ